MSSDLNNSSDGHEVSRSSWNAIYTRHQHEKSVAQILKSKGFEVFLPLYASYHRWKDRNKLLSLPLFPCYLFIKGGFERRRDVVSTPGMHALVCCAGQPVAIPAGAVEALRLAVEGDIPLGPHPLVRCGDWVRVTRGPLEGVQGILVRERNLCRLVLSVEILGKAAAVEVDSCAIEKMNGGRLPGGGADRRTIATSQQLWTSA